MTLESAIKYYEGKAAELENTADVHAWNDDGYSELECLNCAADHRQLAEWLRELKAYKKVRRILSQNRIATDRYGDVVLWDDIKRVLEEVDTDDA